MSTENLEAQQNVEDREVGGEVHEHKMEAAEITAEQEAALAHEMEENFEEFSGQVDDHVVDALSRELTDEDQGNIAEAAHGLKTSIQMHEGSELGDWDPRPMVTKLIETRYEVSMDDFIESQRPSKLEYVLNPFGSGSIEIGIWAYGKIFDADNPSKDLSGAKKWSVKSKFWADGAKAIFLLFPGIGTEAAIALEGGEAVLRGSSAAAEKIDKMEDPTSYEASREMTLGLLPKNEDGTVNQKQTEVWIQNVAAGLGNDSVMEHVPERARGFVKMAAEKLASNPEKFIQTMQKFDEKMQARKAEKSELKKAV